MNWKILSSEYLTRYFYFTARKDVCETPEGKIIDPYYVVEQDPSVCALGITEDGFALMVKQYRHPIEQTILEIPGGFIDKGESPLEAVAREMLEETGYEFSSYEQVCRSLLTPAF